jgi:hypothetical protein
MTCRDFVIDKLDEFVDDELPTSERQEVESHIHSCKDCLNWLKNYKATVGLLEALGKDAQLTDPMPDGLEEKLKTIMEMSYNPEKEEAGKKDQKSLVGYSIKSEPLHKPKLYASYFANCPRDATGHCLPKGQSVGRNNSDGTGLKQSQLAKAGGTGEPQGGNTFVHAKNVIRHFREEVDKLKDKKYVKDIGKAVGFLRGLTRKFTGSIIKRYGKTGGMTILATGQALGWGSFVVSSAAGVPLYIPGSTILGSLPAVVLAEAILQLKKNLVSGVKALELSPSDADKVWREFQMELVEAYQKWLEENSEIVDELEGKKEKPKTDEKKKLN